MPIGKDRARGDQAKTIADTLRDEIIAGKIAPETRLGQDELAKRFGVSRMPVREALLILDSEGLVDLPPNRSAVVAQLNAKDMRDIFDMRIALETLAIRLAIPKLSNATIEQARDIQDRLEQAQLREFGRLNGEFHMTLYAAADRDRLIAQIRSLSKLADRYLRLAISSERQRAISDSEHRSLIASCFDRDSERAAAIIETHISTARDGLSRVFET